MPSPVNRRSVDLSAFPDLVVIYLGMRVRTLAGIKTLLGLGPPVGFQAFAPGVALRGPMFSARKRLHLSGEGPAEPAGAAEPDLY